MERPPYLRLNFSKENFKKKITVDQIVKQIKKQVSSDIDFSHCKLPPVRVLAHQLGVSKNTIQNSYDELKAQGVIESKNRIGLYVSPQLEGRDKTVVIEKVPTPKLVSLGNQINTKKRNSEVLNLSTVFIDPRMIPKEKISECFKSVLKLKGGLPDVCYLEGYFPLRAIIAKRLNQRGMAVDPRNIIITGGSQQALDIVSRTLKSHVVATENPAYHLGKVLFDLNGLETAGLPIDPFNGVNLELWEKIIENHRPSLLYLTSNFQNPSGYSYSSKEISYIVKWSKEYQFGILEDDWGSDMLSYSEFRPGLRAIGGDNVLYMNSFTKKLMPSLRIGYIVANDETREVLLSAKRASSIGLSSIIEHVLFEFLDRGYYDSHLKNIQRELDKRYNHCLGALRELMPDDVKWTSPGGGPVLWVEIPKRYPLLKIKDNLEKKDVLIQTSDLSFFESPHLHGFMLGYAFLNETEMNKALLELSIELKKYIISQ